GVDGWLARRSGLVSRFGARFDMEVDAALALILSLHLLAGTAVGAEALVLGLARYAFVAAGLAWPWLSADLPPTDRRKR
ncbi:CDP-alcohol phosphatidyltransferase family protein, partial [Pseudomonas syringae group genomosp. 7]|uniref:CDP-alcohol phosphatidyltransferase family protein n=1 Tax=Pseudomonas syringae group genomosp. 7 TaxID=251699 RepID=UPI00376F5DEF